ncbi:MAG: glucose-1-phosphate adenylyltransferase subunit GlgD, partial [Oscillospiraceae bacterium]
MTHGDKVLGIIFPNMHDESISELTQVRTMASVPFGGRYRLIDFVLSAMVAADISNVCVIPRKSYVSLMDHVGSGKEWDLARKRGGLKIFPPYGEAGTHRYKGKLEALDYIKKYIESSPCDTVILADCGVVSAIDYRDALKQHTDTNASITVLYSRQVPEVSAKTDNMTLEIQDGLVTGVLMNDRSAEQRNVAMWTYILSKELLLKIITQCCARGMTHFEKDVLQQGLKYMRVYGYEYKGYLRRMSSLQNYYRANLDLIDKDSIAALCKQFPIYTKIRDDAPVRYAIGSDVKKIIAGDGCYIEGTVENSVLFRGVKIGKGAVVKNCVLLQDTEVMDGAVLENVICDKG